MSGNTAFSHIHRFCPKIKIESLVSFDVMCVSCGKKPTERVVKGGILENRAAADLYALGWRMGEEGGVHCPLHSAPSPYKEPS